MARWKAKLAALWRQRWWTGPVGVIVVVMAARLACGWWAKTELDRQLAAIRARGEPVKVEDVAVEQVPDSENAATLQIKAGEAAYSLLSGPRNGTIDYENYPPYPPEWWKLALASEKVNGNVLKLAREARGRSRFQLRQRLTSPIDAMAHANEFKGAANIVSDSALYQHLTGNDAQALEQVRDVLYLAVGARHDPFLVAQLVANGIDTIACETLQVIGPGLRFYSLFGSHPADREQVRRIIADLLDERLFWKMFPAGIAGERLWILDYWRPRWAATWIIRPLAQRDIFRMNYNFEFEIEAARQESYPAATRMLGNVKQEWLASPYLYTSSGIKRASAGEPPRYSRWFGIAEGDLGTVIEREYRVLAERRLTAVALAWQVYRVDHGGRWPKKLEDLVPKYLTAVPKDPFHEDGREIGYVVMKGKLPGGGDRPLLYYDAGSMEGPMPQHPLYEWLNPSRVGLHDPIRQYRDLLRFEAKSAQAVDQ